MSEITAEWVYGQVRFVATSVLVLLGLVLLESTYRQREIRSATARVGWAEDRLRRLEDADRTARLSEEAPPAAKRPTRPAKKTTAAKAAS